MQRSLYCCVGCATISCQASHHHHAQLPVPDMPAGQERKADCCTNSRDYSLPQAHHHRWMPSAQHACQSNTVFTFTVGQGRGGGETGGQHYHSVMGCRKHAGLPTLRSRESRSAAIMLPMWCPDTYCMKKGICAGSWLYVVGTKGTPLLGVGCHQQRTQACNCSTAANSSCNVRLKQLCCCLCCRDAQA